MSLNDWSLPWPGNWRHYHISMRDMTEDTGGGFDPTAVTFSRFNSGAANYLKTWQAIFGDPVGAGAVPTCDTLVRLPIQVQQGVGPGVNQFAISFSWYHAEAGAGLFCNWRVRLARVARNTAMNGAAPTWVDCREAAGTALRKYTNAVPYLITCASPVYSTDDLFVGIGRVNSIAGNLDTLTGLAYVVSLTLHYRVH